MTWIVLGIQALVYGVLGAEWAAREIRDRATRPRQKRAPGKLRTVRGIARGPHSPSPFEGVPCLFAWVRLCSENNPLHRAVREIAVGRDFELESPEGRFVVRVERLRLVGAPRFAALQPVESTPSGVVAHTIEVARMTNPYWAEVHVRDGDELEVTGVCRLAPDPAGRAAPSGYRDAPLVPTLSGGGGRLDVRFLG